MGHMAPGQLVDDLVPHPAVEAGGMHQPNRRALAAVLGMAMALPVLASPSQSPPAAAPPVSPATAGEGEGVRALRADGVAWAPPRSGHEHFAPSS